MALFKSKPKHSSTQRKTLEAFEADSPDVAFMRARDEFHAANGRPIVESSRYFILACILGLIALVMGITFYQLLPLKTVEPYVVGVDGSRGLAGRADVVVTPARDYQPERPIIERELFRFVQGLYLLNADYPNMVREAQIQSYGYTRGQAMESFKAFIDAEQPYQRMAKIPGLVRSAERGTFSFREDGRLVLIRFKTSESDRNRPAAITRDWVMTLQFERTQPKEKAELDINPLGIYITHFEITEER